jgi:hypothetical protein
MVLITFVKAAAFLGALAPVGAFTPSSHVGVQKVCEACCSIVFSTYGGVKFSSSTTD